MFTISQIAETVNGTIDGNPDLSIIGVCDLKDSNADHLSFIDANKYEKFFHQSKANAVLVGKDFSCAIFHQVIFQLSSENLFLECF